MTIYYLTDRNDRPFLDKNNNLIAFSSYERMETYCGLMMYNEDYVKLKEVELDPEIPERIIKCNSWEEVEEALNETQNSK